VAAGDVVDVVPVGAAVEAAGSVESHAASASTTSISSVKRGSTEATYRRPRPGSTPGADSIVPGFARRRHGSSHQGTLPTP
jgi:hypothetical protein